MVIRFLGSNVSSNIAFSANLLPPIGGPKNTRGLQAAIIPVSLMINPTLRSVRSFIIIGK